MRNTLLVVAVLLSFAPAAWAQAPAAANPSAEILKQKFVAQIGGIAQRVDGVMSYAIVDLTSGERFTLHDQNVQPTASTIKLAVLYELMKQAEDGKLSLDAPRPLDRQTVVGGAGILMNLGTPSLSLRDHATLVAILSDNTAANVLIDTVGMDAVNARLRSLDLTATRLRRRMMDSAAARRGDENVSTAGDLARLMEILYRGQGLSPASRDEALRILKIKSDLKVSPMQRGIPDAIDVASKEGDLEGVWADVGIVYAKNRPYVFAAMTTYLRDDKAGERAIEELSRAAYDYFNRLGAGSEYGRQIGR
jgi:beta-lactamase class A